MARKLGQDIDRLDQFDTIQAFVGLFELVVRRGRRRVVGDGCRTNGRIGRLKGAQSRLQHFCGGLHAYALHAAGNVERCRAQHKRDRSTAASGLPRQGDAHLARRSVANEAHGVDRLVRGAGGYHNALACQVLRDGVQHLADGLDDVLGLAHASRVHVAAGKVAAAGSHHMDATVAQCGHIGLRRRRLPHAVVHSGCDHDGSRRGKQRGGDEVIGDSVGHLGDDIGRRGRHDHKIRLLCQRNVVDGVGGIVE